ncbi:MAG: hypothetical protein J5724_07290 [Ruminococcus sp.]|nr:hypothetical protein [Ruminococcus sp.]
MFFKVYGTAMAETEVRQKTNKKHITVKGAGNNFSICFEIGSLADRSANKSGNGSWENFP